MKSIILFIPLYFFFFSCSSIMERRISDASRDAFKDESFLRYSEDRLTHLESSAYKGVGLCHSGNYQKGLKILRIQALKKANYSSYWNQVGLCYFIAKNYIKASFYFDLSIEKSKKKLYAPALNNKGILHLHHKRYQEALDNLLKARKAAPHLKVPQFNLAQVYLKFYLLAPAQKILSKLHRHNSKDIEVIHSLASVHLLQNQVNKAQRLLASIPTKQQNREDVALLQSLLSYRQEKYLQAMKTLEAQKFTIIPLRESATKLRALCKERLEKSIKVKQAKVTKG